MLRAWTLLKRWLKYKMAEFTCPSCRKRYAVTATSSHTPCPHCAHVAASPSRWFLARNKKKYGPYTWQQLVTLVRRGEVKPDDMLLQEGAKKWVRAETLPALFHEPTTPKARPKPAQSKRPLVWLIAGAGVLLLLTIVLTATIGYLLFRRDLPPADVQIKGDIGPKDAVAASDKTPVPKKEEQPRPSDKKPTPIEKQPAALPRQAWIDEFLTRLNRQRKLVGLGGVTLDAELSEGCTAHALYLAKNIDPRKANGQSLLDEDPAKVGYTDEGARAGKAASVAFAEPLTALDRWIGRLYSRASLLNPETRSIGLGFEQNQQGDWICVLDMARGRGDPIIVYPAPKQESVPISFAGGIEVPDKSPAGFPVSVTFPKNMNATDTRLELRDDKGNLLDGWRFDPENPLRAGDQRNSVALIPRGSLASNARYHVKAAAQVNGKPWKLAWSFTTEDDSDRAGIWAKKLLDKLNGYRRSAGLKAVTLDSKLSAGCLAHARYLVLNEGHPLLQGLKAHDEFPELPGYSEEGKKAGQASDIGIGDYEPIDALDSWMATLYHRVPILEPHLQTIGFGCVRGGRLGWVTVLDVMQGRASGRRLSAVFYPAPDQSGVPLSFPNGGEEPNPIPDDKDGRAGYPITAFFPPEEPLVGAKGTLADAKGTTIRCWFSSPEKPANPQFKGHQGNTVCLIPEDPLAANTTYHVRLQGTRGGKDWQKQWKFTTGEDGPSIAEASRQVLARYNEYRAFAGLSLLTLDDKLSRGCQRHAEYLVQNADELRKKKSSVNEEDPRLPGFSAEGNKAAGESLVFTNAPTPVMQIDDLMATFANRVYLLDPQLKRIGFGCAHDVGRGWRCVLDINNGRGGEEPIRYPVPKQTDVPLVGHDRVPDSKGPGFPISVSFPRFAKLRNPQAILVDADNKHVDVWVSSPALPLNEKQQQALIGIHPLQPLVPGMTYSVTLSVIVDGNEWRQTWTFTTAKR
jgi:uncharacterized protein YkwD